MQDINGVLEDIFQHPYRRGSRVSKIMPVEEFIKDMEESYAHKFASKPQVIEGTMKALKRSVTEVCQI